MPVRTSPHLAKARAHGHPIEAVWLPEHPNQQEVEDQWRLMKICGKSIPISLSRRAVEDP